MRRIVFSTLTLLALQTGCSDQQTWQAVHEMVDTQFPDVASITTDELARGLADTTSSRPVLLDARSKEEYAVSHLKGAHRINPQADSFPSLDTLGPDTPIVVYCSVGYRSARIAHRLETHGFRNVYNLRGSIFQWANEERPIVRDGRRVHGVHPYSKTWGVLLTEDLHCRHPAECGP